MPLQDLEGHDERVLRQVVEHRRVVDVDLPVVGGGGEQRVGGGPRVVRHRPHCRGVRLHAAVRLSAPVEVPRTATPALCVHRGGGGQTWRGLCGRGFWTLVSISSLGCWFEVCLSPQRLSVRYPITRISLVVEPGGRCVSCEVCELGHRSSSLKPSADPRMAVGVPERRAVVGPGDDVPVLGPGVDVHTAQLVPPGGGDPNNGCFLWSKIKRPTQKGTNPGGGPAVSWTAKSSRRGLPEG